MSVSIDMSDNSQGQSTGDVTFFPLFIIGGASALVIAIIITIMAILVGVCLKINRANRESVGTLTANIKVHKMPFPGKSAYSNRVENESESEMQLNKAYVMSGISKASEESVETTVANEVHEIDEFTQIYTNPEVADDIKMERNEAHSTSIITERNNAYVVNMATKKNDNENKYY